MNSNKRIAATVYSLETLFVSGIYVQIPCIKEIMTMIIIIILLIDGAKPGDRNVTKKETEKVLKYKDLLIEIQRMWNVTAEVVPVIIGVNTTISKSLRQYLSNITGKHDIKELKKTAILGTAHTLREVLM
jgi:hypothetical protein